MAAGMNRSNTLIAIIERAGRRTASRPRTWSSPMIWFCLIIAVANSERGAAEATDWMNPPAWPGNYWGPAATRARAAGQLPPLPTSATMARWSGWGRDVLREGDIVFRLGDARAL